MRKKNNPYFREIQERESPRQSQGKVRRVKVEEEGGKRKNLPAKHEGREMGRQISLSG